MAPLLRDARIPAVYFHHKLVEDFGALASLGEWWLDSDNRAVDLAVRVLAGHAPATLPVDQLSRPHLAVSLACARSMGITVPPAVLARAQEVFH